MKKLLKSVLLTTLALAATGLAATAAAATKTLTVNTPVIWNESGTKVYQSDSGSTLYLSPRPNVTLAADASTNFVAHPPTGQYVEWWSYGVDTRSDKAGWVDNSGVPNIISNATETFEWDSDVTEAIWEMKSSAKEAGLGCKFAWIPFEVVFHSEDETEKMSGTHTYPESFALDPNPFERTGYTFDHWQNEDGTKTYADCATVSGESLGVVSNWVVDLYAVWSTNTYDVAFDGNGATAGTMASQAFTYDEEQALAANAFSRSLTVSFDGNGGTPEVASASADSSFAGWAKTSGGSVAYEDEEVVKNLASSGTFNLYAVWTPRAVTLPTATHDGATFAGWYTAASGGTRVGGAGDSYTPTKATTLYAHWNARYKVTFEYRDQTGDWTDVVQYVDAGGSATPPTDHDKAPGYTFMEWNKDYSVITCDTFVKAVYEANHYYLYFMPNADDATGEMERLECAYDQSYVLSNGYARTGYTNRVWNTSADGSGTDYAIGSSVKKLTTTRWGKVYLYAQWSPISYTVSFEANGGTGTMNPISLAYDEAKALPANAFAKGESVFLHWTSGGKTYADGATVSNLTSVAGADVVMTAVWKEAYWVDYAANGGEGTMPTQTFYVGETGTLATVSFTRLGCTFAGWRTNEVQTTGFFTNCATVVDLAAAGETNTLYVVWSNNAYAVSFYPNGGEGTMTDQPLACHEPQTLSPNAFTRVNAAFRGWALDPSASEPDFSDGQEVTNLTYAAEETVKLYALWEIAQPPTPSTLAVALDAPALSFSTNALDDGSAYDQRWSIVSNASDAAAGGNDQYVRTYRPNAGYSSVSRLFCTLPKGSGTFAFSYRAFVDASKSSRGAFSFHKPDATQLFGTFDRVESWTRVEMSLTNETATTNYWQFLKRSGNTSDYADVDLVTWTPDVPDLPTVGITFRLNDGTVAPDDIWANLTVSSGVAFTSWPADPTSASGQTFSGWYTQATGGERVTADRLAPLTDTVYYAQWGSVFPVPSEKDRVEPAAVTVSGGQFGIAFAADESFAYYLLATDSLSPVDWQRCLGPTNGTGTLIFTPLIDAGHPQRFFKIETVQREE